MYHIIRRKSDGKVFDCRSKTPGIEDVHNNQVVVNEGGRPDDYVIVESAEPVEIYKSPEQIEAEKQARREALENRIIALRKDLDAAEAEGLTGAATRIKTQLVKLRTELNNLRSTNA